jgi:hypothetical protein
MLDSASKKSVYIFNTYLTEMLKNAVKEEKNHHEEVNFEKIYNNFKKV